MEKEYGKLYIVATPIGNLEDITLRAINILKSVDLVVAEDTRHSLKLLNHLEISKPLVSYHRHNEDVRYEKILEKIKEGKNIALISDAGTPIISDPGEVIVKEAIKEKIEVIPVPGACAAITALMAAGVDTKKFIFYGFLSLNKKIRKKELEEIQKENRTMIIYEAPHKLKHTLEDFKKYIPTRNIVLARELTKIHEEFARGTAEELEEKLAEPKGEYIIIIDADENIKTDDNKLNELTLEEHYKFYEMQGLEKKEIIKKIAKDRGMAKNEIYMHFI